jgi:methylated-DNA-protein-cysteine methyltransferase-like protein
MAALIDGRPGSSVRHRHRHEPATIQRVASRRTTKAEAAILRRVRAIPPGYVRTYGDISPGAPRLAGYALSHTDAPDVPWHRVVRADGSLAKGARQRRLLEAEAVPFHGERVVLSSARLDDLDAI